MLAFSETTILPEPESTPVFTHARAGAAPVRLDREMVWVPDQSVAAVTELAGAAAGADRGARFVWWVEVHGGELVCPYAASRGQAQSVSSLLSGLRGSVAVAGERSLETTVAGRVVAFHAVTHTDAFPDLTDAPDHAFARRTVSGPSSTDPAATVQTVRAWNSVNVPAAEIRLERVAFQHAEALDLGQVATAIRLTREGVVAVVIYDPISGLFVRCNRDHIHGTDFSPGDIYRLVNTALGQTRPDDADEAYVGLRTADGAELVARPHGVEFVVSGITADALETRVEGVDATLHGANVALAPGRARAVTFVKAAFAADVSDMPKLAARIRREAGRYLLVARDPEDGSHIFIYRLGAALLTNKAVRDAIRETGNDPAALAKLLRMPQDDAEAILRMASTAIDRSAFQNQSSYAVARVRQGLARFTVTGSSMVEVARIVRIVFAVLAASSPQATGLQASGDLTGLSEAQLLAQLKGTVEPVAANAKQVNSIGRLQHANPALFGFKEKGYSSYARQCGMVDQRQPFAMPLDEYEAKGAAVTTGVVDGKNVYVCPEMWCPASRTPMTRAAVDAGARCGDGSVPVDMMNTEYWKGASGRHIGFLDPFKHPRKMCMPCCYRNMGRMGQARVKRCGDQYRIETPPVQTPEAPRDDGGDGVNSDRYILTGSTLPLPPGRRGHLSASSANSASSASLASSPQRVGIPQTGNPLIHCVAYILGRAELDVAATIRRLGASLAPEKIMAGGIVGPVMRYRSAKLASFSQTAKDGVATRDELVAFVREQLVEMVVDEDESSFVCKAFVEHVFEKRFPVVRVNEGGGVEALTDIGGVSTYPVAGIIVNTGRYMEPLAFVTRQMVRAVNQRVIPNVSKGDMAAWLKPVLRAQVLDTAFERVGYLLESGLFVPLPRKLATLGAQEIVYTEDLPEPDLGPAACKAFFDELARASGVRWYAGAECFEAHVELDGHVVPAKGYSAGPGNGHYERARRVFGFARPVADSVVEMIQDDIARMEAAARARRLLSHKHARLWYVLTHPMSPLTPAQKRAAFAERVDQADLYDSVFAARDIVTTKDATLVDFTNHQVRDGTMAYTFDTIKRGMDVFVRIVGAPVDAPTSKAASANVEPVPDGGGFQWSPAGDAATLVQAAKELRVAVRVADVVEKQVAALFLYMLDRRALPADWETGARPPLTKKLAAALKRMVGGGGGGGADVARADVHRLVAESGFVDDDTVADVLALTRFPWSWESDAGPRPPPVILARRAKNRLAFLSR